MAKVFEGKVIGKGKRFGIVVSRFNDAVSKRLLDGAIDCLVRHNCDENKIEVYWTPGAFEIPPCAKKLAQTKRFDAIICLGTVIRGDTPHFDFVAGEVAKGIARVGLEEKIPTIFGVVTADNLEQALDRAGGKLGNRGESAALSAIELADLYKKII